MRTVTVLLLAAVSAASVFAQQATNAVQPQERLPKVQPILIFPSDKPYPPELAAQGAQGDVMVRALVRPDGTVESANVAESSRSSGLDEAALLIVGKLTFRLSVQHSQAVLVPLQFRRDSSSSLSQKTCSEFNADLEYFKKAFPERQQTDAHVFTMSAGLLTLMTRGEKRTNLVRALANVAARTIEKCASEPERRFFAEYTSIADELAK